jgi:hypothetical protein
LYPQSLPGILVPSAAKREGETLRRTAFIVVVAALMAGVGSGVARADRPPQDLAGQPFYFSATCTDLGDVILFNQSLARTAALTVVGSQTVILAAFGNVEHARIFDNSTATCTFTGGGFTVDTIEPFDEPFELPVVIVNG